MIYAAYNIYDKPLFDQSSKSLYTARKGGELLPHTFSIFLSQRTETLVEFVEDQFGAEEEMKKILNTQKFQPEKGFQGAEGTVVSVLFMSVVKWESLRLNRMTFG